MKKNWKNNSLVVTIGLTLLLLVSCNRHDHTADTTYTCPMHPTVISDRPGSCPVCGMDLVRKARPGEEVAITNELSRLIESPNQAVVSSIELIKPEFKSVPVTVEAVGIVTYDTRNVYTIPARVGGRIEKMYVKYEFQSVRRGQKIAEIYSPELITAQRELLYLIENDSENQALIDGAKQKLELLGLSASQIEDLLKHRTTRSVFAVHSPYTGYVITSGSTPAILSPGMSQAPASGNDMGEMGSTPAGASPAGSSDVDVPATNLLREGNYVSSGQTLVKLVNTDAVRIELDLPGTQSGLINVGDKIELDLGSGQVEMATVDFVQPFFSDAQNFLKIRVYTKRKDLSIGQLVRAKINVKSAESLWIPKEAVLDLGTDQIVFIKDREVLKPKKITVGIRTDTLVEVKGGIASAEEIASNAQYLVDSESFIKPVN